MKGPATIKADCTVRNADNHKMRLSLKAGREVRVLSMTPRIRTAGTVRRFAP